ncbi:MAG: 50S ribosomal protein L5 [Candidatus Daviesbacteria bacterium]|nr:50S ribosomal protein L5 [Candidatus Daviesbacteria bacterium]
MSRLRDKYKKEVLPKLKEEYGIKNQMAVPSLKKIVINVGMGDAKDNKEIAAKVVDNLTALAGQKPVTTVAKQSIAGFKLGKGNPIGAMVTLRGERMYDFLDKLISIVLPKVRDFRGISNTSFDSRGNYTLGLPEQTIFPEITFQNEALGSKIRGLEISIVGNAKTMDQGKKLLELLGMPFKKEIK